MGTVRCGLSSVAQGQQEASKGGPWRCCQPILRSRDASVPTAPSYHGRTLIQMLLGNKASLGVVFSDKARQSHGTSMHVHSGERKAGGFRLLNLILSTRLF